jgi:hypothetical protein
MGDPAVAIGEAELQRIGEYVKGNLKEWLQQVQPVADSVTRTELLERITRIDDRFAGLHEKSIRIEEELKSQRELMETRFTFVEQRFEIQDKMIADRFAVVDQRFTDLQGTMEKRFAAVDKRFEDMQVAMDKRFEDMKASMEKRFSLLTWLMGVGIASGLAIIGILVGT